MVKTAECLSECEFLPFNGRPLKNLKNYSGTRTDKISWIGTGWWKIFQKYVSYGKYPAYTIFWYP